MNWKKIVGTGTGTEKSLNKLLYTNSVLNCRELTEPRIVKWAIKIYQFCGPLTWRPLAPFPSINQEVLITNDTSVHCN